MYAHAAAERLVRFFITVHGRDLGQAGQILSSLFIRWFEVLAVSAPWGVEPIVVRECLGRGVLGYKVLTRLSAYDVSKEGW